MYRILISKGIQCRREDVRKMVRNKDPEGVQLRKWRRLRRRKYTSLGPNFVWHIDGHDKLKPYGFSIHGGIDGFSRRALWLEISKSNKMPEVIAKYYLDAVQIWSLSVLSHPLRIKESKLFGSFCCETKLDGGSGFFKI